MTTSGPVRLVRLLGCVLLVPLLGGVIATILRAHADSSFGIELERSLAPGDALRKQALTLTELCAGPDADTYQACHGDAGYRLFAGASVAAGAGGLVLLAAIATAAAAARTDRRLLLALFRPGLYVTATVVTGLIAVHAVIATIALFAGVQAVLPGTPMLFGGVILAGALAGVRAVGRALFGALRDRRIFVFGGHVTRKQAPELWRLVEVTAARLRALPPDHIVVGLDANFFVTEVPLQTPNGPCDGRTLFCSLPFTRILTIEEFTAVLAHELGHFRGADTAFSQRFYPIYAGATAALEGLAASSTGARAIALLPATAIFEFFVDRFALADGRHARERELVADAASVEVTSPRAAATALVKSHAYGPLWPSAFAEAAATDISAGGRVPNASVVFASAAARAAAPALLDGILETHTPHPTDRHPSLAVRLEALGVALPDITLDALDVAPAAPAATLLPIGVLHEEALSAIAAAARRAA
jgi:Zn-dependent protease with chaperone function